MRRLRTMGLAASLACLAAMASTGSSAMTLGAGHAGGVGFAGGAGFHGGAVLGARVGGGAHGSGALPGTSPRNGVLGARATNPRHMGRRFDGRGRFARAGVAGFYDWGGYDAGYARPVIEVDADDGDEVTEPGPARRYEPAHVEGCPALYHWSGRPGRFVRTRLCG